MFRPGDKVTDTSTGFDQGIVVGPADRGFDQGIVVGPADSSDFTSGYVMVEWSRGKPGQQIAWPVCWLYLLPGFEINQLVEECCQ